MSRRHGTLVQWDDAKGYGFIAPDGEGARLFVHIRAFGLRRHRPIVGERLSYRAAQDAQGKWRAADVQALAPASTPADQGRDRGLELLLVPAFALLVLVSHLAWGLPQPLWSAFTGLSLATFLVYWMDKRASVKGRARVSERTLHALALAGGWPGALLAQHLLRHKTRKPAFLRFFWLTVCLNLLGFVLLFTPAYRG
jgi:uncharacterized membrane protein YsdA (DUF1294 family)/cold shock CspA family protein